MCKVSTITLNQVQFGCEYSYSNYNNNYDNYYPPDLCGLEDDGSYYELNPWQLATPDPSALLSSSLWVQDHSSAHDDCSQDLSHSEPNPPPSPGGSVQHSHNGGDDKQSSQCAESQVGIVQMVMQNFTEYIILLSMVCNSTNPLLLILLAIGQICDVNSHDIPLNTPPLHVILIVVHMTGPHTTVVSNSNSPTFYFVAIKCLPVI